MKHPYSSVPIPEDETLNYHFMESYLDYLFTVYRVADSMPAVFVETGTYRGHTVTLVGHRFREVHTIELSDKLYREAIEKFKEKKHVICHHGDSATVLEALLPTINEPIVFFLDAHYAGGGTAYGKEEIPLLREVEIIAKRKQQDVIIIDDVDHFGKAGKTGTKDSAVYPPSDFDWTDVTLQKIRKTISSKPNFLWIELESRLIIATNRSLPGIVAWKLGLPFRKARSLIERKGFTSAAQAVVRRLFPPKQA
jgi:hypothetical protein